jgi:hypothetical protein
MTAIVRTAGSWSRALAALVLALAMMPFWVVVYASRDLGAAFMSGWRAARRYRS